MRGLVLGICALFLASFGAEAAQVDLSQSPCFAPGTPVSELTPDSSDFTADNGRTYDARGHTFTGGRVGVITPRGGRDHCVVGPRIDGGVSDSTPWKSSIKPDGIQHARPTGPYRVHGASIRRANDGLSPPKAGDISRAVTFSYRDIYGRQIRDDMLENDACLAGEIRDSLFDGIHMGMSSRPGGTFSINTPRPTVLIEDTMMRLVCQTDTRDVAGRSSCPSGTSHATFFKTGSSSSMCRFTNGNDVRYSLRNVIFRADERPLRGMNTLNIPSGTEIDNVTVIYLGPDPELLPKYPAGVRVITDAAEGERVWNEARNKWLADHGCDQNGDNCAYLTAQGPDPAPEPEPETGGDHTSVPPGLMQAGERGTGTGIAVAGSDGVVDLATSECFNRAPGRLWRYPEGRYKRPFVVKGSVGNTYDLRGTLHEANAPAGQPLGRPMMFPILFSDPHETCVVGATVQGTQSRNATWVQMKNQTSDLIWDGDGIGWENSTGRFIVEGAWIDNMEDGVGMPFDLVPDRSTTWSLRHVYARWIRDDVVENDGMLNGTVEDSLFDGIWTPYSGVPSKAGRDTIKGPARLTVRNSLMRLQCMPDTRGRSLCSISSNTQGAGQLFKGSSSNLNLTMENVIFMIESGVRRLDFPPGTYRNVTVVWGGSGSFPGQTRSGISVTTNRNVWENARANWLARHGCDSNGNNCSYLHHHRINETPPVNTEPYLVIGASPRLIPLGNQGTIQWWAENVVSCSPFGHGLQIGSALAGQRRLGPRNISNWPSGERQVIYGVSCQLPGGGRIENSDRLTWFNRSSDSHRPSVPANVRAEAQPGSVALSWNESTDNFFVASYRIYRNGEWIANVSSRPLFVDSGVSAGEVYSYQAEAFDSFGNLSGRSGGVEVVAE